MTVSMTGMRPELTERFGRFLVTGSRTWTDQETVYRAMLDYAHESDTLVVGGASGADSIALAFWTRWGGAFDLYRVTGDDWRRLGKRAGHLRNERMIDSGVDICLAFINICDRCPDNPVKHGTHGAIGCVRAAWRARVPTATWGPGSVTLYEGGPEHPDPRSRGV